MKRIACILSATLVAASACSESSDTLVQPIEPDLAIFNVSDEAALRAALGIAENNGQTDVITIKGTINLTSPLSYTSDETLTLQGRGARLIGPQTPISEPSNSNSRVGEATVGDVLQIFGDNSAPDVTIDDVVLSDGTGHGIYYEVSSSAGAITADLSLKGVTLAHNGLSGLWMEEQASDNGAINTPASLSLSLDRVRVMDNGYAEDDAQECRDNAEEEGCPWADFDGIRLNEGGPGNITYESRNAQFTGNAGDGLELDEKGTGDVIAEDVNGKYNNNGFQPQFPEDLEDGYDIDEEGSGSIYLTLTRTQVNGNIDEGIDIDEDGLGDIDATFNEVAANENADDNIKFTEDASIEDAPTDDDFGSIIVDFSNLTVTRALDGDGIKLEEFGGGTLSGTIRRSNVSFNDSDGLDLDANQAGIGVVTLQNVTAMKNGSDDVDNTDKVIVVYVP